MPHIPAWIMVIVALVAAHIVSKRQGIAFAIPRYYVALLFVVIYLELLGSPQSNNSLYVAVNRYGYILIFLVDIIPAAVARFQRWKNRNANTSPHNPN